jgi:hypothetical protein
MQTRREHIRTESTSNLWAAKANLPLSNKRPVTRTWTFSPLPSPWPSGTSYSALAFLTGNPVAAGLLRRAGYPLPGLRELNRALRDSEQEQGNDSTRR